MDRLLDEGYAGGCALVLILSVCFDGSELFEGSSFNRERSKESKREIAERVAVVW
jgi:hypothetical protein